MQATRYPENKSVNGFFASAINLLSNREEILAKLPLFRLKSRVFQQLDKIFLFPLNSSCGLGGDVVADAVYVLYFF